MIATDLLLDNKKDEPTLIGQVGAVRLESNGLLGQGIMGSVVCARNITHALKLFFRSHGSVLSIKQKCLYG